MLGFQLEVVEMVKTETEVKAVAEEAGVVVVQSTREAAAVVAFPVSLDVGCDEDDAPLAMRKVSTQGEVEKQARLVLEVFKKAQ